jgi:ribosomal protein S18 acetylase RimI-like enzyme
MTLIVALVLLALAMSRLLRSPRGSWRYVLGAGVVAALATQLLPPGHPLRVDVAQSSRNLGWVALGLVPVAIYAFGLQRLRRRTGVARPASPARMGDRPILHGLVQIAEDAALVGETEAALGEDAGRALGRAPQARSLGWRTDEGALVGHLRLVVLAETCEILLLRVAEGHRRQGIGSTLLQGAEDLAREAGAGRMLVRAGSWQDRAVLARVGYRQVWEREIGPGLMWSWLEKELP